MNININKNMNTNKHILITGGSGLVGSSFKEIKNNYLEFKFTFLSSKDCDLKDFNATKQTLNKYNPDIVIHLAAEVGGLYKNMKNKVEMYENNILINLNVLKSCHELNIDKCYCMLSTCIFPDKTNYPINEDMLHNGPPHISNDAYAYAKRMMEVQCNSYNSQYNRNYCCIIPCNIYGENDNYSLENSHVIPGLIHKCYLAKKENKKFIIYGSGKPLRQFIYGRDLANIILLLIQKNIKFNNLIISPSEEVSISDIANIISKKFNYYNIEYDTEKSDGQFKKTANNNKLFNLLQNLNINTNNLFIPIHKGINDCVDYFINNYDKNQIRI